MQNVRKRMYIYTHIIQKGKRNPLPTFAPCTAARPSPFSGAPAPFCPWPPPPSSFWRCAEATPYPLALSHLPSATTLLAFSPCFHTATATAVSRLLDFSPVAALSHCPFPSAALLLLLRQLRRVRLFGRGHLRLERRLLFAQAGVEPAHVAVFVAVVGFGQLVERCLGVVVLASSGHGCLDGPLSWVCDSASSRKSQSLKALRSPFDRLVEQRLDVVEGRGLGEQQQAVSPPPRRTRPHVGEVHLTMIVCM